MVEIISVRFKEGGKQYYFNPDGQQFQVGDGVIVDTTRGTEYGLCTHGNSMIDEIELMAPLRPVVRKATQEDKLTLERNKEKEKKAFAICQEKIAQHGLDMKLVEAEYSFEGNKVLFFFTSDGRVDFRALVKDLAGTIHARIELRQIGVRDEARMLGGLGICGRPFCCAQFLDEFQPVSIKMAKTQNLSLNPTKISGACGRLMCCLKYEQDAYEDLVKHAPKQESFVETPDGAGTVSSVNLLRQTVQVRLDSAPESPKCYHNCELCVIRSGKGKRPDDYVQPPLEELAKLRRSAEEDQAKKEADALTVALENAFPGRPAKELRQPAAPPPTRGRSAPPSPGAAVPAAPAPRGRTRPRVRIRTRASPVRTSGLPARSRPARAKSPSSAAARPAAPRRAAANPGSSLSSRSGERISPAPTGRGAPTAPAAAAAVPAGAMAPPEPPEASRGRSN